jgi:hypothetical protein
LTEDAACAEEREGHAYDCGHYGFAGLRRLLRNVLHHLHSARVEKVAQLVSDLVPGSRWILPENYSYNREQKRESAARAKRRCSRQAPRPVAVLYPVTILETFASASRKHFQKMILTFLSYPALPQWNFLIKSSLLVAPVLVAG